MTCPCGRIDAVHRALGLEDEILAFNLRLQVLFATRHHHLIDGVIHHTGDIITILICRPLHNMGCPNGSVNLWARLVERYLRIEVDIVRPCRPRGVQGLRVQMEFFIIVSSRRRV